MNKILTALLLVSVQCFAQERGNNLIIENGITRGYQGIGTQVTWPDCGVWKTKSDTSGWVTVDTMNIQFRDAMRKKSNAAFGTKKDWVYDRVKSADPMVGWATLEYNPCKGTQSNYEQYRICRNTGIRQRRTIINYGYYEKELSPYDEVVKKFTNE